jgi:fumarylpyruvate hydrolase
MDFAIPAAPVPIIPVSDSQSVFPVRRIYCVGRNYAAHAREMGSDPAREAPFFFSKPADAVLPIAPDGSTVLPYPPATANLHHEIEMVLAIGKGGHSIAPENALEHVWGYALGLDMTRRDIQFALRDKGRPWDMGKGFDHAAPITAIAPARRIGHPASGRIWLKVNDVLRQEGDLSDMIWSVSETIAHLSGYVGLQAGDLIFTGTPEGVGPVVTGDKIEAGLADLFQLSLRVGKREP